MSDPVGQIWSYTLNENKEFSLVYCLPVIHALTFGSVYITVLDILARKHPRMLCLGHSHFFDCGEEGDVALPNVLLVIGNGL